MADQDEVREVAVGTAEHGERLEEGATEILAGIAAGTGVAGVALGAVQAYYSRASYELQRQEALDRAEERAEYLQHQRELYEMRRRQAFECGGLAALDDFDEWNFDGPFLGFDAE
jgi:hypothetical protein